MDKPLVFFIIVALCSATYMAVQRWDVEQANRSVEIVADWEQVQEMSACYALSQKTLLTLLKKEGVQGVAITEETLSSLRDRGLITITVIPLSSPSLTSWATLISSRKPWIIHHLRTYFTHRYHLELEKAPPSYPPEATLVVPYSFNAIRNLPIGFWEEDLAMIRSAGLEIVGRVFNTPGLNPQSMEWLFSTLKQKGIRVLIFAGDAVLGFRDQIRETARLLNRYQMVYGSIEFGKQQGDETLSKILRGHLVRVHSITPTEISKIRLPEITERYTRAARERNIRILYLRLLPYATRKGLQDQVSYLRALRQSLLREGLILGKAIPFKPLHIPLIPLLLIGLGVSSSAVLLLKMILRVNLSTQMALLAVFFVIPSLFIPFSPHLSAKGWALLSALTFPTLALLQPYRYMRVLETELQQQQRPPAWKFALLAFIALSGITLMGALLIVGLLADRDFLVKADTFVGIKLAHILPLLGLAGIILGDLVGDQENVRKQILSATARWRRILGQPLSLGAFLGLLVVLGILFFLLARTGNEPGVGVSSLELKVRSLLDQVLLVRPRTKEFLLGHPALVMALFLAPLLPWGYRVGLLLTGAIGQVSLVNTYCHIHTPLQVSLLRTFHGMWIGYILGWIFAFIASKLFWVFQWKEKSPLPRDEN